MQRIMERTGCVLPRISNKQRFLIFSLFVFLLLTYGCKKKSRVEDGLGYIQIVNKSVYYKNYKSLEWEGAKAGTVLYRGDYIRTGDNSSAILNIEKETISIEENTLIRIDRRQESKDKKEGIELVILNGELVLDNPPGSSSTLTISRLKEGKRINEDLSAYVKKIVTENPVLDTGYHPKEMIELLSPCNDEVLNFNNVLFKWRGDISGELRIASEDGKRFAYALLSENNKYIELKDGIYEWSISRDREIISNRCRFEIRLKDSSLKPVNIRDKKVKGKEIALSGKTEEIPEEKKGESAKEDIVKKRLTNIDRIIQKNIEDIKNTKKSIDVNRVKNYASLYNKLDELNNILQDLKTVEESLLLEIMKLESPSMIADYLLELEDIESNLRGINKEIGSIQQEIYQNNNGEQR